MTLCLHGYRHHNSLLLKAQTMGSTLRQQIYFIALKNVHAIFKYSYYKNLK